MVAKRTRQLVIVRRVAAAAPVAPLHPLLLAPLSPAFICAHCVLLPPRPASPSIPLSPSLRALTLSCKAVARVFVPCTLITCRVATWCHVAGRIGGLHHHRYPLSLRRAPGARRCAQVRPGAPRCVEVSRGEPSSMWGRSAGGHQWIWTRASTPLKVAPPSPSSHVAHSRVAHSRVAHSHVAHSHVAHSRVAHSRVAHSPVAHSHVAHSRVAHSRVAHSRVAHSRVAHSRVAHSRVAHSRVAHSHVAHSHVAHSHVPPSALLPPRASIIFTFPPPLPFPALRPSLDPLPAPPCLPPCLRPWVSAEQVARMAAADVVGVVREEVGRVGGQVDAVQALQRASAQAGGDRGAELEARAREAEERAVQLNETVGRLQAALRQHSATIAALQAAEQAAAGVAGKEGGRPLGRTVVEEDHPGRWRQHTFHRTGAYGFIQYSAYRLSAARIAVVGMGALGLRSKRRVEGCWWHRLDGHTVIAGRLTQMVMEEHHNYLYELVVLQCVLEEEVEETGGHLRIFLDRQVLFPFREDTKEKIDNGTGPMPYRFAYCGPPMHMEMEQRSVQQFIHYHRYAAGYDHFQLYDATAVTPALTAALQPLMDDGLLSMADFREAYEFDSWYFSQAVAMHDCMYGMRSRADWIAFHDLDEYLALPPPASRAPL
ncbi:unnamed protein product [Closterium sp. NIES-54]